MLVQVEKVYIHPSLINLLLWSVYQSLISYSSGFLLYLSLMWTLSGKYVKFVIYMKVSKFSTERSMFMDLVTTKEAAISMLNMSFAPDT